MEVETICTVNEEREIAGRALDGSDVLHPSNTIRTFTEDNLEQSANTTNGNAERPRVRSKTAQIQKTYSPVPLRTFPLPSFIPHNPLSILHIVYSWLVQSFQPPTSHPVPLFEAWYSPRTRSIQVTNRIAVRALWEHGFYGKGSLSRSEPTWLEREKGRIGITPGKSSEDFTRERRAERQKVKWERARKEREAIEQVLRAERDDEQPLETLPVSSLSPRHESTFTAPVGPKELLGLPNSTLSMPLRLQAVEKDCILSLETNVGSHDNITDVSAETDQNGTLKRSESYELIQSNTNLIHVPLPVEAIPAPFTGCDESNRSVAVNGRLESLKSLKPPKTVRFSSNVENTTYVAPEPPSPISPTAGIIAAPEIVYDDQINREHLQLTMEEALWLSYGLGILDVLNKEDKTVIPSNQLFYLGQESSCFPSSMLTNSIHSPDDTFLLSYVVYHHFRSLGWVVRGGTKFSVDYLLYNRGPVFTHAEFAIIILPSYTDPYWSTDTQRTDHVSLRQKKRWSWLHCVNRVNTQVKKSLVLAYVDIPPPIERSCVQQKADLSNILKRYKVREIALKRWISNRSRD